MENEITELRNQVRTLKRIVCLVCCMFGVFMFAGCASTSMLPKSASEVDFEGIEGKTGWSSYEEGYYFPNITRDQVYAAAKSGLGNADFCTCSGGYICWCCNGAARNDRA